MGNKQSNNINKICFCGKQMEQYPMYLNEWACYCCCKIKHDKIYYRCVTPEQCEYYIFVGGIYQICDECFNILDIDDYKENLKVKKIKSIGKVINKQMKLCKNNKQQRAYLVHVYKIMYTGSIGKLNDEILSNIFNEFYNKCLESIKNKINMNELELHKNLFINEKQTQKKELLFDLNTIEVIKLKWDTLQQKK
eukprot:125721_1